MPTAAKLIAGIVYSVGAVFVVWLYMQSNQRIAYLINDITLLCAAVSFIVGWIVVGGRAPKMLTKPAPVTTA